MYLIHHAMLEVLGDGIWFRPVQALHVYGDNTVSSLPNVAAQFSATGSGGLAIGDENGTDGAKSYHRTTCCYR